MRWALLVLFVVATNGAALGADQTASDNSVKRKARANLPAGLPHANYKFRTTIRVRQPPEPEYAVDDPDVLFTPSLPYLPPRIGKPLLPGSSALPGYYGSSHSYDYRGPYYGGPYVKYYERLPYACGIYGYC